MMICNFIISLYLCLNLLLLMLRDYLVFSSPPEFKIAWWLSIVEVNFPIVTKPFCFPHWLVKLVLLSVLFHILCEKTIDQYVRVLA